MGNGSAFQILASRINKTLCVLQFAMAARHLSQQAGSVFPLKTLTQEQVAQVQQQIQTSNQFQNNLQVMKILNPEQGEQVHASRK